MEVKIPEIEARNILETYEGANNQILEWKRKLTNGKGFKLARTQALYILNNHETPPKVARKYITLVSSFGEKLMEERLLPKPVKEIWCEKLLTETDKAYHIWGKILDSEHLNAFWLPKGAVLTPEKKLKREIDYSKYAHRPPKPWQPKAIEFLLANDRCILADDMGLGKMEFVDNKLFTPYGRKKIGDIKVGDKVIGSNGKDCEVRGVFPQGVKKTYKVTFNDGYSLICGGDHLWKVYSNNFGENTNNDRKEKEIVLSTKQMLDPELEIETKGYGYNKDKIYKFKTYYKLKNGNLKWQIPIVKPIEFENNVKLPIDPYLLGLSLGDGHIEDTSVTFVVDKYDYDELFEKYEINENKGRYGTRKGRINLKEGIQGLHLNNVRSWNKFIPEIYKYSSIEDRLSLLQGLMDTDGSCNKSKNGTFKGTEYTTVSEQLADDVAEIVHSLGGIVRKRSRVPKYTYKGKKKNGRQSYRLNVKLPEGMNPFRLKRKSDLYNTPKKYKIGRYIKNIEPHEEKECVCISVDSPDKLYVTEHAIVTHNTTSSIIASLETDAKKVLIVCPASVKINWKREIKNYSDDHILIVEGRKWGSTFKYYIINYDIIKNFHTTDKKEGIDDFKLIENEKFDLAIVDEAHYLSNAGAKRTKLMNDILDKVPKVWLLTGTPMTSRPINYFNLLKIINSPVALNWQHYVRRYCKGFQFNARNPDGTTRKVWSVNGHSNLDELRERTKGLVLRRLKTEVPGLPEKIIIPRFLELQSTFYNEELEEFMRISEEERANESISITLSRLMKVRQVIAYEKVPYTCQIIDEVIEQGKKVIVFNNFSMPIDMIQERYPKNCVTLDGTMSQTKRQSAIDRFQSDPKINIMNAQIVAGGIGINLTAAEVVIMNDLSFVPAHHNQAEDRAYRHGQKNNVLVYYPIFENTIEQIIYNILQLKKGVISQVMGDNEYDESFTNEVLKAIL